MNKVGLTLFCLALTLAPCAFAQAVIPAEDPATQTHPAAPANVWPQEPTGFAGLPFGASKEDVEAKFKVTCEQQTDRRDGIAYLCVQRHYVVTNDVYARATFKLVNGEQHAEFNGVELEISNRGFSEVKALLIEKYGPPMVTDARKKTSDVFMMGAAAHNTQYHTWLGPHAEIKITEPPQPLAKSVVVIQRRDPKSHGSDAL